MNRIYGIALSLHLLPTVGFMLQGTVYLTTSEFMPYHAEALNVHWSELSLPYQGFVIGVIRGMGAGSFTVALALLIILLIPYRRRETWTYWAVPAIGLSFSILTAYAAFTIDVRTPASTPWPATCGLALMYAMGGSLTLIPRLRPKEPLS
ncbi:MAG: hypothetical protein U0936_26580 [Planctomycetaceae bacterium]